MSTRRLSGKQRAWIELRLSDRDHCVLDWVARLRLATGRQLESLCFHGLANQSQPVVRGRVLGRLCSWQVIEVVDHR
ncbi:MAG: hypothetical protein JO242_05610, partial [Streptosporangiaceae bacterium]|nr:hypothetical protein [Streptosporangiaceae bacterium]